MKNRCSPLNPFRADYYDRGIRVCIEWEDSFEKFLNDVGRRPSPKHSIHRVNNDGNYEPSNVKWATPREQAKYRRSNVWMRVQEYDMILVEVAAKLGVSASSLSAARRKAKASNQTSMEFHGNLITFLN